MPVPVTPPEIDLRVVRSRVDDPELLADELGSAAWLAGATVVKSDERSSVLAGDVAGRAVIVKTVVTSPLRSRAPAGLGRTKLARQWSGAEALIERGLPTVEPVLMWAGRSTQGRHAETLVLERVAGPTLLRAIAQGQTSVHAQHALARAAGDLTARLAVAGLFNRDHKPSNVIAGPEGLVLIDTAGITALGARRPERMLFNLIVEFVGTHTLPRRTILLRALVAYLDRMGESRPGAVRAAWTEVERLLAEHPDPTPKDDPLAY